MNKREKVKRIETLKSGLWIKIMTRKKGLHTRFIDDILERDILWLSVEEVREDKPVKVLLVKDLDKENIEKLKKILKILKKDRERKNK